MEMKKEIRQTIELMKKTFLRHDWIRYQEFGCAVEGIQKIIKFSYKEKVHVQYYVSPVIYFLWREFLLKQTKFKGFKENK